MWQLTQSSSPVIFRSIRHFTYSEFYQRVLSAELDFEKKAFIVAIKNLGFQSVNLKY